MIDTNKFTRTERAFYDFLSYAATCKQKNTREWFVHFAARVNEACEALGFPDRFDAVDGELERRIQP